MHLAVVSFHFYHLISTWFPHRANRYIVARHKICICVTYKCVNLSCIGELILHHPLLYLYRSFIATLPLIFVSLTNLPLFCSEHTNLPNKTIGTFPCYLHIRETPSQCPIFPEFANPENQVAACSPNLGRAEFRYPPFEMDRSASESGCCDQFQRHPKDISAHTAWGNRE